MPMSPAGLSATIKAGLIANPNCNTVDDSQLQAFCDEIATAVINHIIANATITVSVTAVTGVTTGVGISGPGTGTATIV